VSRVIDFIAVVYSVRHCNDLDCGKCRARYRWKRRKSWRSRKSPARRNRARKR
jgi:hypothetical protein